MKLKIHLYGDPVLRLKAQPVEAITDEIRQLISDMLEDLRERPAWGLSAPQVGQSLRLLITCVPDARDEVAENLGPPRVYINPVLTNPSSETRAHAEGCLSIPGIYPVVSRPAGIHVEAIGIDGKPIVQDLWGWQARVVMHENDHLNGVLNVDRASAGERRKFEQKLREIKKRSGH